MRLRSSGFCNGRFELDLNHEIIKKKIQKNSSGLIVGGTYNLNLNACIIIFLIEVLRPRLRLRVLFH